MSKEIDSDLVGKSVEYKINPCQIPNDKGTIRAVYMKDGCPYCMIQDFTDNRLVEIALAFCYIL